MNTLNTLQTKANKSQFVTKTRQTTCIVGSGMKKRIEKRLFIWFDGTKESWMIKEDWLTGDDRKDLAQLFKQYMAA